MLIKGSKFPQHRRLLYSINSSVIRMTGCLRIAILYQSDRNPSADSNLETIAWINNYFVSFQITRECWRRLQQYDCMIYQWFTTPMDISCNAFVWELSVLHEFLVSPSIQRTADTHFASNQLLAWITFNVSQCFAGQSMRHLALVKRLQWRPFDILFCIAVPI